MLTIRNLTFHYNNQTLFKNINISIQPGGIIFINGSNGSGKTTLLRIIAGLLCPYSGRILYQGQDIHENKILSAKNIAFIGHEDGIKPMLSVKENIMFRAKIENSMDMVNATIKYLELEQKQNVKCIYLSRGWQKRVALAMLMVSCKTLWVLDEPFANLDTKTSVILQGMIDAHCNSNGIAIISSTNKGEDKSTVQILQIDDFA